MTVATEFGENLYIWASVKKWFARRGMCPEQDQAKALELITEYRNKYRVLMNNREVAHA